MQEPRNIRRFIVNRTAVFLKAETFCSPKGNRLSSCCILLEKCLMVAFVKTTESKVITKSKVFAYGFNEYMTCFKEIGF